MQSRVGWRIVGGAAALALVGAGGPAPAAEPASPPGPVVLTGLAGDTAFAVAVNARGDVLGNSLVGGSWRPTVWPRGGAPVDLGVPYGSATAINETGSIVGSGFDTDGAAYLWRNGRLTSLAQPGQNVFPADINDRDQVVGTLGSIEGNEQTAFLWQRGQFTTLPTPADRKGYPVAVNNRGQVIGYVTNADWSIRRGVIWTGGKMVDLGTLGGPTATPTAINDHGVVIGLSDLAGTERQHPFRWSNGRMTDLPGAGDERAASADGINDAGVVVGMVDWRPVRWSATSATPIDIGRPGRSGAARTINDRGEITGLSYPVDHQDSLYGRPFRWRHGQTTVYETLPGGTDLYTVGIDGRGRIVGTVTTDDGYRIAIWGA